MASITAPQISLYSVTGANYGKLRERLFSPPELSRFVRSMAAFAEFATEMDPERLRSDSEAHMVSGYITEVLGFASGAAAGEGVVGATFRWYSDHADTSAEQPWIDANAELGEKLDRGLGLAYALTLFPDVWLQSDLAGVNCIVLRRYLDFLDQAKSSIKATRGDGMRAALSMVEENGRCAQRLLRHMKRVASGKEFYSLYPPPHSQPDAPPQSLPVRIHLVRTEDGVAEIPESKKRFQDVYREETPATRHPAVNALLLVLLAIVALVPIALIYAIVFGVI